MNVVALLGNLGRDPEVRYTNSGKAVCSFSLAVSEGRDKTTWVRCTAWEKTAELMGTYMTKGSKVAVEGRLSASEYKNKDGVDIKTLEVVAFRVHFAEPPKSQDRQQRPQQRQQPSGGGGSTETPYSEDDDIPFSETDAEWSDDDGTPQGDGWLA